ncbi:hypothetical protein AXF42_Ash015427 [Apostasia shenzhenica]|uniref:DUF599 domain-containing protein n=1 Tax=Apostasia shenzhenica TaxID=1088818 RepID=A0A2H9ZS67_9ASPA|nr:hypothetical protein AXF42_Ash015427 [Apostasia shenzhenica]
MAKQELDFILVPIGLAAMVGYHLWLLLCILHRPTRTVIGINAINRRIWVCAMMEDPLKNGVLAVQTLRNNIMASTLMASTAIMLSSLVAVLMTGGGSGTSAAASTSPTVSHSVKFFAILLCFLLAFLLNIQSVRYYSHASTLINVPVRFHWQRRGAPEYVAAAVNRGSYFWSLGLRACYFSFPMFLWIFGPIPMASCCFILVVVLYYLDMYAEWVDGEDGGEGDEMLGEAGGEPC